MEIVAFVTLSTGTKHKITQEEYNHITEAPNDEWLQIGDKIGFKKSAIMEIQDIGNWDEPIYNYGQPYKALPAGVGFNGIINTVKRLSAIEALAKGLRKAKNKLIQQGRTTKNIDEFLELARKRYSKIKAEVI